MSGFFSIPLESSLVSQCSPFPKFAIVEPSRPVSVSRSEGVAFPLETSNRNSEDWPLFKDSLSSPEKLCVSGKALSPNPEPPILPLEGFQVEGLTPGKMVKVQSVLGEFEDQNYFKLEYERIRIQEEKEDCKRLEWAALPACGASGGIVILWDSSKFECTEKVLGSFSVTVKFNSGEEGSFWLTSVYGPINPLWRKDFWLELQDLYGLTFPRWCVGGDFNVIRRIFEKLGETGLTFNMSFQEALPRWTSDHSPICLETNPLKWGPTPFRFENMWLLHPEFKEKFRVWWQECTDEGWEGHKFMRKLKKDLKKKGVRGCVIKEEVQWRQKSRVKWIKEEDCNSKFFHRVATGRRSRKFIKSLISERGETLNSIEVISEEIVNFFGNLYSKPVGESWRVEGIDWVPIFGESGVWLDRPFTEEEVRMAVFQLNKEKAPGPDGFTIAVYQECWDVIKEDLMRVFLRIPHQWGRLRKVLHETISGSQGAFVEGRHILDVALIANEVVDEKRRKGFSQKWRSWIRGCLSSSSFTILVNGNAKGWVKASRGLRQGDPLSPFLFTLVADVLSSLSGTSSNLKIILLVFGQVSGLKNQLREKHHFRSSIGREPKDNRLLGPGVTSSPSLKSQLQIASKIEKMQGNFLWSGAREGKKDHLVKWEVVSRPKELGGLGFGKISLRNIALLGKWLWRFLEKGVVFGIRCPWKAIAQVFQEFSPFVHLVVGNGERIRFWEDLWWGNQSLCSQFANLYRVISVKNLTVSNVLGNSFPLAWNLNFRRNLTDSEIDLLQRLMSSLSSVCFSPSLADSRVWSLSSSGLLSVKSFFLALSKVSNPILFLPAKFLWSSKAPSKVKALAWIVAHGKVNTNDKLQLRRPYKSLYPQWCILCKGNGESIDHLFLHCPVTIGLWNKLFKLAGLVWVPPRSFEDMLCGKSETIGFLRIREIGRDVMGFDFVLFLSLGSCSAAFRGVPLNVLQLNWSEIV
ncbi:hypothetical protein CK203_076445 [Vitis vinifera]|uniref:Reverse transcriptase zinc-binding domain-containing protein n=1 Tax=Vitis vinifera TaxID=29760 RepID=A0A438C0I5_VITVI|nr:hypothetical protein CK203_076445 [Vitis vinifera]